MLFMCVRFFYAFIMESVIIVFTRGSIIYAFHVCYIVYAFD
jgi:hypothetical protein